MLKIIGISALAGLLFGFDTGIISGAILFIQATFSLSHLMIEIVLGSILVGALLGALCSGFFVNIWGRKAIIQADSILFIAGTILSAFANSVDLLIIGRLIVGFGIGIASYIVPLYISELSPAQHRGGLVALNTIAVTGGIFISYLVSFFLSSSQSWEWMLGVGVIPAIFLLLCTQFLPETPRWLIKQGKISEAKKLLQSLRHDEQEANKEVQEIQNNLKEPLPNFRELINPKVRKVLLIGITLAVIQQITGINVILYYTPLLFKAFGFDSPSSIFLLMLSIGFLNFFMTIVTAFKVDRLGRRSVLLFGLAGMTISLFILATSLRYDLQDMYTKWVVVISLFSFIALYACSIGCIFWIVIAEIYPLNIRGLGMGIASAMNWIANLFITITFLSLVDTFGISSTFFFYAVSGLMSWFYCYRYLPETAQASLEHIEAEIYEN